MQNRPTINLRKISIPGIAITGITGGIIGSFMGGILPIIGMAVLGAVIGNLVWALGEQRFFVLILVGIFLGAGLAIYLGGMDAALLGAGTGGAIGGFVSVNLNILRPRAKDQ